MIYTLLFNIITFVDATQNTSKQVIVRATLLQHFTTNGGMGFYGEIQAYKDNHPCLVRVPFPVPHPTNYFLKNMVRRFNFSFLDNFSIYYERGDLTKGKLSNRVDCSHHWVNPELIYNKGINWIVLITVTLLTIFGLNWFY